MVQLRKKSAEYTLYHVSGKSKKHMTKPNELKINSWDHMFRTLLSMTDTKKLGPNLKVLYAAILLSLPKNNQSIYQRLQGNSQLFKAVKEVPGLRFKDGEFTLEDTHSISLFGC